jgi:hypothetical protein
MNFYKYKTTKRNISDICSARKNGLFVAQAGKPVPPGSGQPSELFGLKM